MTVDGTAGTVSARALGTRLYVDLGMPDRAAEVAAQPVDGVGRLQAEFRLTEAFGGEHPRRFLARRGSEDFLDAFEPHEHNPVIGFRGCYRYVWDPTLFALELRTLERVREQTPNLHLMIPFGRTEWELEACLEMIDHRPLAQHRGLHRQIGDEVPSVAYWIPGYARMGIDGVPIGSTDLTQPVPRVDRDSETCADLFDESDPAVVGSAEWRLMPERRR